MHGEMLQWVSLDMLQFLHVFSPSISDGHGLILELH